MNTSIRKSGLTVKDLQVNSGVVRPAEVPLWVGHCAWKHMGENIVMAVSRDKSWFWVRFGVLPLPPHLAAEMTVRGFTFSPKKRMGYWAESTPERAKFLRTLGFADAKHIVYDPAQAPAKLTREENNTDMGDEAQPKGTLFKGLRTNSQGRVIDERGHFVSNEKLVEMVTQANGTAKTTGASGKVFTPPAPVVSDVVGMDEEEEEMNEDYTIGYADGEADGNDSDVPDIRDRLALAKYLNVTMAHMAATLGSDYILGYLEGFEDARPKQVVVGAKARLAARMGR